MEEIEIKGEYYFKSNFEDVTNNIRDKLLNDGFNIIGETKIKGGYSFHAKRGAQIKLGLFGGASISRKDLPIKLNIKISKTKLIQIGCSTDIGFGSSLGMKEKLELTLKEVRDSFHHALDDI